MKSILLLVSMFFISSTDPVIKEEKIKFCLVFNLQEDLPKEYLNNYIKTFMDEEISKNYTYRFIETLENNNDITTEIYYEDFFLGTIYGKPNKKFLMEIIPDLEEQIESLSYIKSKDVDK